MSTMNAAVVTSFEEPPHYQRFEAPQPTGLDEVLVDVLAVGLHPRVRTGARGAHYTSTGRLPMIPGIDGVGRRPDGKRIYFVADDEALGTMAEQAVVDERRTIVLPDDVDEATLAATMNPAMSSWVALRRRVPLEAGQSVLVLGATGNAGTMAVRVAKRLGPGGWSAPAATSPACRRLRRSGSTRWCSSPTTPMRRQQRCASPPPRWTSCSTTCGASLRSRR